VKSVGVQPADRTEIGGQSLPGKENPITPIQLAELLKNSPTIPNPGLRDAFDGVPFQVWLTNTDGYLVLNWKAPTEGSSDFVVLYAPGADITNPNKGSPYETGTYSNPGYVGVYWSYDANQGYKRQAVSQASDVQGPPPSLWQSRLVAKRVVSTTPSAPCRWHGLLCGLRRLPRLRAIVRGVRRLRRRFWDRKCGSRPSTP
jgi:hypothetical protein